MTSLIGRPNRSSVTLRFGMIPSHWVDGRLKNVMSAPATDGPHTTPEFVEEGVPFLSVDAIQFGELTFEATRFVSESDATEFRSKAAPRRGDLLMGKAASTGKIAEVRTDIRFCIWSPLALIRIAPERAYPSFVAYLLKSTPAQAQIDDFCTANTQKNISMGDIQRVSILIPPLDEQRQIAGYLDRETGKIDELITKQEQLVARLTERLSSLLVLSTHQSNLPWRGRLRQVLVKLDRSPAAGAETVTAFRDGQVTRRSLRREDGYTFSAGDEGYQGVNPGDLVFHGLDGFAGAVGIAEEAGACSPVYHVTGAKGENSLAYIALLLRALGATGFLATQAGNVRQRSVDFRNWTMFARLPISLPKPVEQFQIVEQFRVAQARTTALASRSIEMIALLRERRAALISAAVTGKIDVRGL